MQMEKNVEKQLIVRTFEPDMAQLKELARQLASMPNVSLNLYGQAGEVLIVITARAIAPAAATELTETIADRFEQVLGEAVYGRGKGGLAYFAAGELIENEASIVASDSATGALLAEEFSHTKRGNTVFDFGDVSYNDSRVMGKIKSTASRNYEKGNLYQMAAARAAAAAKCARAEFGVSVTGGNDGQPLYLAVSYKGHVYMRSFKAAPDAAKRAALAALDIVRRLSLKAPVENARVFKANTDFDWNEPLAKRRSNKMLGPVLVLIVLLVALAVACWYFFTHFSLGGADGDALAVDTSSSVSQSVSEVISDTTSSTSEVQQDDSTAASSTGTAVPSGQTDSDGKVRPFA